MSYASTVLADRPVGYWRLNENSGTTVVDSAVNGVNQSYVGTKFSLGQPGLTADADAKSVLFNDTTGLTGIQLLNFKVSTTPSFEVLFNLQQDIANGNNSRLFSSGSSISFPFDLAIANNQLVAGISVNELAFFLNFTDLTPGWQRTFWVAPKNVVTHFIAAWDGTWFRVYANGQVVFSTSAFAGHTLLNASSTLGQRSIGNLTISDAGNSGFPGLMDEAAFYYYPLNAAQALQHYQASLAASTAVTPTPVASLNRLLDTKTYKWKPTNIRSVARGVYSELRLMNNQLAEIFSLQSNLDAYRNEVTSVVPDSTDQD